MSWRIVFAAVLAAACIPARGEEAFFPLMAWGHTPNDPAVLKRMSDCGLTVAGFVSPAALDACRDVGLKAIVDDARSSRYDWMKVDPAVARTNVEAMVKEVKDHPAVFGYLLRDEPSAAMFPGLAAVADAIQEFHPGAWPYINLFPNYAEPDQMAAPDYEAYVRKFVEVCKPPILSYDHYALYEHGRLRPTYFANLETLRRAGLEHGLPFWNIILTTAHFDYREATPADIRFQVFTSLAYGAKGIAYFTYFSPKIGNFRLGPIDQFGNETPTWAMLREVNLQVARLAPTLLKLKSDAVYHFGEVPTDGRGPADDSLVEAVEGPMLVGDFTHEDGSRWAMIVNRSFTDSIACRPAPRVEGTTLEQVSPFTGRLEPYDGERIWLAPGQGVLLRLTAPADPE